ncbi:SipW-dependent-type signal peptide-containing protein [Arenivirga flava]|nr:SipW-dependent-type signal peptide-containing protein [Arenivirga flava]
MSRSRRQRPSSRSASRHRRARGTVDIGRFLVRGTLATVVVAFAALLGLGGTAALWSSTASVSVPSVTAGSIDITQSTLADATVVYANGTARKTTSLVVKNTGSASATVSAGVAIAGDTGLASAIAVNLWRVSAASSCTETAASSGDAMSWSALGRVSSTVAAGETQVYCLRTSLTSAQISSYAGKAYSATLTLTAKRGGWTSVDSLGKVAQSVKAVAASAPRFTCNDNSGWNTNVVWSNPSGVPDTVKYQVRTGSTVLGSNGTYWNTQDWIEREAFSNLARNRTYTVDVIRTDTGATIATGAIRYDSEGKTWCA